MLMMLRMAQAFITAAAADFRAEVEHHFHDRSIGDASACAKNASCTAHLGTVQIHGDTLAQFSNRLVGQTRIGAGNACLLLLSRVWQIHSHLRQPRDGFLAWLVNAY
jgi:hypothetical protein